MNKNIDFEENRKSKEKICIRNYVIEMLVGPWSSIKKIKGNALLMANIYVKDKKIDQNSEIFKLKKLGFKLSKIFTFDRNKEVIDTNNTLKIKGFSPENKHGELKPFKLNRRHPKKK